MICKQQRCLNLFLDASLHSTNFTADNPCISLNCGQNIYTERTYCTNFYPTVHVQILQVEHSTF